MHSLSSILPSFKKQPHQMRAVQQAYNHASWKAFHTR